MARISVFLVISLTVTIFYFIGLLKLVMDVEENKCEMTYMFEYPQFIKVSNPIDKKYPKYGLFAYGEGRLTSRVRSMYFDGIPVLFIPGNAGSYKQVRSLSSVALRKALGANTAFHFDYFTVDLNDEFSGLYGPLLFDQLEYVNHSFHRIFKLYKNNHKPQSIVLIGHSMGGVIAKKFLMQLSETNAVPLLITLASPLKRHPLMLDHHLQSFYDMPNRDNALTTTVINLSGGYGDFLIPTILTKGNETDINIVTTNVPMSWIENNHVEILWCKQLILPISRALFDSVDPKTNVISTNSTLRHIVFNHHLNHNSGIKIKNLNQYSQKVKLDLKGKWMENLQKQYTVENLKGVKEPHWFMVKFSPLADHEVLNILALNLEIINWVYVCNANLQKGPSYVCPEAYQLTHLSEIAPSILYKRRFIQLNLRELYNNNTELTHVVFRTLQTDEPIVFHVDVHGQTERHITVDLPKWWSAQKHVIVKNTREKAVNLRMYFPGLQHVLMYYSLFVEPHKCSRDNHHASASLVTPWGMEDSHAFFTSSENKPFDLRLYSSKPGNYSGVPYVNFILDPSCTYEISVRASLTGSLEQTARFYTPLLITHIAVVLLLALKYQILSLKQGHWPIIFTAITRGPRGYYVLTLARIFAQPLKFFTSSYIPKPDIWYITDDGLDLVVMPFLLYLFSVGIVWFVSLLYGISLFTLESTANKVALKLLTRTFIWSNYFMIFLHKVPALVAAILVFLTLTTCGSLALCLGTVFYFLRLTQMSQDYVEDVAWSFVKKYGWKFLNVFFKKKNRGTVDDKGKNDEQYLRIGTNKDSNSKNNKTIEHEPKKTIEDVDNTPADINKAEGNSEVSKSSAEILETMPGDDTTAPEISDEGEVQEIKDAEQKPLISSDYNRIFFHSSIFYLWCLLTFINIPAVLTWAHNFKYHKSLSPDDSFLPGFALSLCAFPLWHLDFPRKNKKGLNVLSGMISIVTLLCLMFATVSLYRLNYLLTFVIVIVTLHQLFAPQEEEEEGEDAREHDDIKEKYEEMKKKLD